MGFAHLKAVALTAAPAYASAVLVQQDRQSSRAFIELPAWLMFVQPLLILANVPLPVQEAERRAAYAADVTYVTNSELGFDYLRDNLAQASIAGNVARTVPPSRPVLHAQHVLPGRCTQPAWLQTAGLQCLTPDKALGLMSRQLSQASREY